ncbi:snake venom 5'-nucleotidase-like [Branchiostoma lanceolatum]|uniref:snake venom 5'-nucleotidase-like n=1 Tax=Branchiostoma lanceolatum TaxID=7740 RepID=UPI0034522F7C
MRPFSFSVAFAFVSCCSFLAESVSSFNLTVLHTNDVHSRVQEMNAFGGRCRPGRPCYGGFPRLGTKVAEVRGRDDNVLLLDAGDQFQGTLWYYFFRSPVVAQLMNRVKYDAMAIGNHEFDDGVPELTKFLRQTNFSVVSANVNATREPEFESLFSRSVTLNVSGEMIGIVGYTTTDTPAISKPGDTVSFTPVVTSVQTEVDKLTQQGVNKIIALGHAGIHVDTEVASRVRGVDIIVGGHTNTFLYTGQAPNIEDPAGAYPKVIRPIHAPSRPVLVVQDYAFGKYLGYLKVTFDDVGGLVHWEGNPILLDDTVAKDPDILAHVQTLEANLFDMASQSVGKTHVLLDGSCRFRECNMGNLITDSMLHQNNKHPDEVGWNNVGIAVLNAGGIRATLVQGSITVGDIVGTLPYQNTIDIVELQGEDVVRMLEHSASLIGHPRFLQVSGLRVTYDEVQPVGQRVVKMEARCSEDCLVPEFRPLNVSAVYRIIMPTFLADGGDGYTMVAENKTAHHIPGDLDTDILIEYIAALSPLSVGLEGRLKVINSSQTPAETCRNIPTSAAVTLPSATHAGAMRPRPEDDDDDNGKGDHGQIAAIVVGVVVLACVIATITACVVLRMRRRRKGFDMSAPSYNMGHTNPAVVMETGNSKR